LQRLLFSSKLSPIRKHDFDNLSAHRLEGKLRAQHCLLDRAVPFAPAMLRQALKSVLRKGWPNYSRFSEKGA